MDSKPTKKIKIEITEKTFNLLNQAYDEFLMAKDLLPKKIIDKYGSNFNDFVDQILYEYCQLSKKGIELSSRLKSAIGDTAKNFDFSGMSDIDPNRFEEVIKNLFGKSDPKPKPDKSTNKKKDEEVKN